MLFLQGGILLSQCGTMSENSSLKQEKADVPQGSSGKASGGEAWHHLGAAKLKAHGAEGR